MSPEAWWALTLALGLVVAVVVVALLEALRRQVRRIERGALAVWQAGKLVAGNTATTWMVTRTAGILGEVDTEVSRQQQLLGGRD